MFNHFKLALLISGPTKNQIFVYVWLLVFDFIWTLIAIKKAFENNTFHLFFFAPFPHETLFRLTPSLFKLHQIKVS